jgi:hypothetical protein
MGEKMTPPVDCIGLALDLETQEKRVMSQTTQRAMLAAAQGLRRIDAYLSTPAQTVDVEAVRRVIVGLRKEIGESDKDCRIRVATVRTHLSKLSQAIGDKT